ncbi:MAG: hypothetical protein QXF86_03155 [Candidatus Bilamarchaeaceae archaeon]
MDIQEILNPPNYKKEIQEAKDYLNSLSDEEYRILVCNGKIYEGKSCFECSQNNWLFFKRKQYTTQVSLDSYEKKKTYWTYKKWLEDEKPVIYCRIEKDDKVIKFAIECIRYNKQLCYLSQIDYNSKKQESKEQEYDF